MTSTLLILKWRLLGRQPAALRSVKSGTARRAPSALPQSAPFCNKLEGRARFACPHRNDHFITQVRVQRAPRPRVFRPPQKADPLAPLVGFAGA